MIEKIEVIDVPSNSCDIFDYEAGTVAGDIGTLVTDDGGFDVPDNVRIYALTHPICTDPIRRDDYKDIYRENRLEVSDISMGTPKGIVGYEIEMGSERMILVRLEDRLLPYNVHVHPQPVPVTREVSEPSQRSI